MINSEIKHAMALTLIEGVGNINAKKLLAYCGDFTSVFSSNKSSLLKIPGIGTVLVEKILNQLSDKKIFDRVEEELSFIEKNDIQVFLYTYKNYPFNLKQCEDSPIVLYGKGNLNFNNSKIVSVVGTRKVTQRGKDVCTKVLEDLKPHNLLVISGMAYGVDIHAHKICVKNEIATVGVLAHGLDRLYPSTHKPTADKMMKTGGLLTEFMSGTNPDRQNFPTRNRIIAGLADATIVIESAKRGGSLITAEIANSYNRDVFAIPGRITDQYSEGCNYLIKINKAHLLNSAADIVYLMNWELIEGKPKSIQKQMFLDLPPYEQLIYDSLNPENSIGMDELSMKTKLSTSVLSVGLLQLEFKGLVKALPGSSFRLS
ncbi:DNA-processing protein DprA [Flavobacteriales bacterium]|nr:DNA-processing protein DprA [Flavobacteriales bacterium]